MDVVFFCTPAGHAMGAAHSFLQKGVKVIDLSADFRFKDAKEFEKTYSKKHTSPELLKKSICGISELYRDLIAGAELVANPGCYVIASVLALTPIFQSGNVYDKNIFITAINGTSGASSLVPELHASEAWNSLLPYNLNGHRHRAEIAERLYELTNVKVNLDFSTIHGNFARGIFIIAHLKVREEFLNTVSRESILKILNKFYHNSTNVNKFIIINDYDKISRDMTSKEYDIYPNVARVIGSNFCHIGADYDKDTGTVKIISVIDNLVKGAAGSAVQNMNLMLGLDEETGLQAYGL
jgi:N-acetyl-gamma-glutamyl-phosphate reductase/N-acetyl-gamma-glutamyl-phosphate/LysW-gamma-L-alpha-aminoadipyl-6-phosphate reductase